MDSRTRDLWKTDITEARHYWDSQLGVAKDFMMLRSHRKSALIEIAAQHPLIDGRKPGAEFVARLDRGIQLYRSLQEGGMTVEIYVPGSRHVHNGRADEISLSDSGVAYLQAQGVPYQILHGEDLNITYKADAGVYGSADECYVAASYFKDKGFGRFVSIASPAQVMRKALHYIAFGVLPLCYAEPAETMFHNYIEEAFDKIPYVLLGDHDLQSPNSAEAAALRDERRPRDR
jgi:hypothetical protein